tara:strand:+ start:3430 stop:3711 length:282 start_codon:yes stop_codon:yes gene_type:complete
VLFRPEEVHLASSFGGCRLSYRQVSVPNYGGGIGSDNMPVTHLNADPFIAVKTGRVDANGFTWKQPANSQRIRPSNAKPFLLAIHSDSKRGGY